MGLAVTFSGSDFGRYRSPEELGRAVTRGALQAGQFLRAHMTGSYLSGQRLRVRTGKLRSNWQVAPLASEPGAVLGTNTVYAPVQEYGFTGVQHVREHDRQAPQAKTPAKKPKSLRAKLASRADAQRAAADRTRERGRRGTWRNAPAERRQKLEERRARGFQGGVRELQGQAAAGRTRVRAHDRYQRITAKRYLESTRVVKGDEALALMGRVAVATLAGG